MSDSKSNGAAKEEPVEQELVHTKASHVRAARKRRVVQPEGEPAQEQEQVSDEQLESEPVDPEEEARRARFQAIVDKHPDRGQPMIEMTRQAAQAARVISNTSTELPPEERNELKRDEPTIGPVVEADQPDYIIRDLEDINGRFAIGRGYHIKVERKEPKTYGGVATAGKQKTIRSPMSTEEFAAFYGGGKYELIVCGPPKKVKWVGPDGNPIPVPATKPIQITIPHVPPNVHAGIASDEDEEDEMTQPMRPGATRPGMSTNADARIHETNLTFQEKQELRQEQRNRDMEAKRQAEQNALITTLNAQHASMLALVQGQLEEAKAEITHMKMEGRRDQGVNIETLKAMRNPEEITAMRQSIDQNNKEHAAEISRLREAHGQEINRLRDGQNTELNRLRDQHQSELRALTDKVNEIRSEADRRIGEARSEADRRVKETEERHRERLAEIERRAEKAVEEARSEASRRVSDLQSQNEARVADIRAQHQAALTAKDDVKGMELKAQGSSHKSELSIRDQRIVQLQEENAQLRRKAEQPLSERINEVTEAAEALGMGRAGPEEAEDWKSALMKVGLNLASQFPEIVKNAGDAVAKIRSNPSAEQVAAYQARQAADMQMAAQMAQNQLVNPRMGFATEDGPAYEGQPVAPPPIYPAQLQRPPLQAAPPPAPAQAPIAPTPMAPNPAAAPAAPVSVPPPAAPIVEPSAIPDEQILQFVPMFEQALMAQASPAEMASELTKNFGAANVTQIAAMLSPEQIVAALQRTGRGRSPLCRRAGQKFLRDIWIQIRANG